MSTVTQNGTNRYDRNNRDDRIDRNDNNKKTAALSRSDRKT